MNSALAGGRWTVPAVLGPANVADAWAKMWELANGRSPKPGTRRVFELRTVNPLNIVPGQFRPALAEDFERVVAWIQAFHEDAHIQDDLESAELLARQKMQNGDLFCSRTKEARRAGVDGGRNQPAQHGCCFRWLPPATLRGRSYATACVVTLSQQLLDEMGSSFITFFAPILGNPVSNSTFMKIGYTAVADFHRYYFSVTLFLIEVEMAPKDF
ncbi:MAG: hypothetical protein H6656_13240 [Ardenticatenaceae bacterium]|nr:hypothetical protein [Ardenticatenaceae bacterium]